MTFPMVILVSMETTVFSAYEGGAKIHDVYETTIVSDYNSLWAKIFKIGTRLLRF